MQNEEKLKKLEAQIEEALRRKKELEKKIEREKKENNLRYYQKIGKLVYEVLGDVDVDDLTQFLTNNKDRILAAISQYTKVK